MPTVTTHPLIVKTPGTCGGRPRIDGHRIRVQDIAVMYEHQGMTPAEICDQLPTLNLVKVHAALAYYYDHRAEIEEDIQTEMREYEEGKRRQMEGKQ